MVAAGALLLRVSTASAQVTPAKGSTPPDDTPTIKFGTVLYANYTYQDEPTAKDADGNVIHPNGFEVTRTYLNVTGNLHHLVSYRFTPDIAGRFATTVTRGAAGETVSTSYDGNLVVRLKYAFGQLNLDDWLPHGTWVRLGQQQTPFVDFMEGIYRYRFQGTIFEEREGFLTSSDLGLSGRLNFPNNYGEIHTGVYNGDGYARAEANNQKAFQIRGTVRPLARNPTWKGLRLTAFYDADNYIKNGPRDRFVGALTFEHPRVHLGADYVKTKDRISITANQVEAEGYTFWITPRTKIGIEGLLRFDSLKPIQTVTTPSGISTSSDAHRKRLIAGVAYWFKTQGSAQASVFANFEKVDFDAALNSPNQKRYLLSCLFQY